MSSVAGPTLSSRRTPASFVVDNHQVADGVGAEYDGGRGFIQRHLAHASQGAVDLDAELLAAQVRVLAQGGLAGGGQGGLDPALALGLGQLDAPAVGRGAEDVSHVHLRLSPGVPRDDVGMVALAIRRDVGNHVADFVGPGSINDFHRLMIFLLPAGRAARRAARRGLAARAAMPPSHGSEPTATPPPVNRKFGGLQSVRKRYVAGRHISAVRG
jgi:hypothetical protein